jgi:beta-lactamase class A
VKNFFFFFIFIIGIVFVLLFSLQLVATHSPKTSLISPLADVLSKTGIIREPEEKRDSRLKELVERRIKNEKGRYSVFIKNLKTGQEYVKDEHDAFPSASLYKLWVMGAVYERIDDERWRKNTVLTQAVEILNDKFSIASESAELTEGEITYSVENALEKMITISDNYSALLLTEKVGIPELNTFLKKYRLTESSTGTPPVTTAYDTATYFEKLYKKEMVSMSASEEMIERLKRQQLNDRIPKYLPDTIKVAHKTGELGRIKHDAGIVFAKKGDYIFVILTDTPDPKNAAEIIALTSKDVYEYFKK